MKAQILTLLFIGLLFPAIGVSANTLNEAVKEARKQGQVLSAKTRQGMHEIRVVTPQGSVKTIRKPVSQNNSSQRQPEPSTRQNQYHQPTQTFRQQPQRSDNHREYRHSRQPESRRFERHPSQSVRPSQSRPSQSHRPTQQAPQQPRRQPPPRRADKHDPD